MHTQQSTAGIKTASTAMMIHGFLPPPGGGAKVATGIPEGGAWPTGAEGSYVGGTSPGPFASQ